MKTSTQKTNETATRALEVLKLLANNEYSLKEIISLIFESKKSDYELRADSIYKYLNTFKLLGLEVSKNKNKYRLTSTLFLDELKPDEIGSLKLLKTYAEKLFTENGILELDKLLENLCKNFSNINLEELNQTKLDFLAKKWLPQINIEKETFEKYNQLCKEKQKLNFKYFNTDLNKVQTFTVEPEEMLITPSDCILKAYNPEIAETQKFYVAHISDLKQLPTYSKQVNVKNSVTFALKGRLASAYELKKGERITSMNPEYLVITNTEEDREDLLKRLLRYGYLCEILYPKSFRTKAIQLVKKIKNNYA